MIGKEKALQKLFILLLLLFLPQNTSFNKPLGHDISHSVFISRSSTICQINSYRFFLIDLLHISW